MSSKRGRLEIYLEVLRVVRKGTEKPTRIMYKTNLSWKPLMKVLKSLRDQGLVASHRKGRSTTYEVTEKGKNVLKYFTEAMNLIEIK